MNMNSSGSGHIAASFSDDPFFDVRGIEQRYTEK
jgi:hypothetical protein